MSGAKSIELEAQLIERTVDERNQIIENAKARASNILKNARLDVERINNDTDRQVLNIVGSELRAVRDRIVGQAELQGRKQLMEERGNLMGEVYRDAEDRLRLIAAGDSEIDYVEVLHKLISEAIEAIGGEDFNIQANEKDLGYLKNNNSKLNEKLDVNLKIADEALDIIGGIVVNNPQRTKIFHNTLDGRLISVRERLQAEVGEKLGLI
jgi:vacuolar-type H+-ATPase subunit E/Vma4